MLASAFSDSRYFAAISPFLLFSRFFIMSSFSSSNGFREAFFRSVTFIMWYPNLVSTTSLTCPGCSSKATFSNGETICPLGKKSRSPPFSLEGQVEFSFAS